MIRSNDSHLRGLDRLIVLRKVGLVLVLPVGVSVPPVRGKVVGLLEDPVSRGKGSRVV